METFYSILGVEKDAKNDEIKKAYKQKAKQYHPDKVNSLGDKIKFVADMESKRINEAKEVLLDKEKRHEYDDLLKKRQGGGAADLATWSAADIAKTSSDEEEDYKIENEALHALIVSLSYEISNLKTELETEKSIRIRFEDKIKEIFEEKTAVQGNLDSLINIIDQLIADLNVEKSKNVTEYDDLQKQVIEIQGLTLQLLENLPSPYLNIEKIKEQLDAIKDWREASIAEINLETAAFETTEPRAPSSGDRVEWDADELRESMENPEVTEVEEGKVDSELRGLEDLGERAYEEIYEETVKIGSEGHVERTEEHYSVGPYLKVCPFCGKELGSSQSYCYYCGAVF